MLTLTIVSNYFVLYIHDNPHCASLRGWVVGQLALLKHRTLWGWAAGTYDMFPLHQNETL